MLERPWLLWVSSIAGFTVLFVLTSTSGLLLKVPNQNVLAWNCAFKLAMPPELGLYSAIEHRRSKSSQ